MLSNYAQLSSTIKDLIEVIAVCDWQRTKIVVNNNFDDQLISEKKRCLGVSSAQCWGTGLLGRPASSSGLDHINLSTFIN